MKRGSWGTGLGSAEDQIPGSDRTQPAREPVHTPNHLSGPRGQGHGIIHPRRVAARSELRVTRSLGALAWFPKAVAEDRTLHQPLIGAQPPRVLVPDAAVRRNDGSFAAQKCNRSLVPSDSKGMGSRLGGQLSPGSGEGQSRRKAAPYGCQEREEVSNQQCSLPGKARLELYAGLTPSPPLVGDESVHIEGGLLFENEVGGSAELGGQNTQGFSLGVFPP